MQRKYAETKESVFILLQPAQPLLRLKKLITQMPLNPVPARTYPVENDSRETGATQLLASPVHGTD